MDGGLRALFRRHMPAWHWNSIESGMTGSGIPDSEYCAPGGITGWVEYKGVLDGWRPDIRAAQVGWHLRRARAGGRNFFAVRRQTSAGPRKGAATDELWLVRGSAARELKASGLKGLPAGSVMGIWWSGPARWDWGAVGQHLTNGK